VAGDVQIADPRGPPSDIAEAPRPRKLVKWAIVHELTGKSRSQAWRDIRAGRFPSPVQTGPNSVAWYLHEVEAYVASRPRVSYAPQPQEFS
jgi:prophage regulatory protein